MVLPQVRHQKGSKKMKKCPFINFAFGRPVSPILGNAQNGAVEIVFQVCQCVRQDCMFWHEVKEDCKLAMLANVALAKDASSEEMEF